MEEILRRRLESSVMMMSQRLPSSHLLNLFFSSYFFQATLLGTDRWEIRLYLMSSPLYSTRLLHPFEHDSWRVANNLSLFRKPWRRQPRQSQKQDEESGTRPFTFVRGFDDQSSTFKLLFDRKQQLLFVGHVESTEMKCKKKSCRKQWGMMHILSSPCYYLVILISCLISINRQFLVITIMLQEYDTSRCCFEPERERERDSQTTGYTWSGIECTDTLTQEK
jgi:hypothetical protein